MKNHSRKIRACFCHYTTAIILRTICALLLVQAILLSANTCQAMSEKDFSALLHSSSELKEADRMLNKQWQIIMKNCTEDRRKAFIQGQKKWLAADRDRFAAPLLAKGMNKGKAYADVSYQRAVYINELYLSGKAEYTASDDEKHLVSKHDNMDIHTFINKKGTRIIAYGMNNHYSYGTLGMSFYIERRYTYKTDNKNILIILDNIGNDSAFTSAYINDEGNDLSKYIINTPLPKGEDSYTDVYYLEDVQNVSESDGQLTVKTAVFNMNNNTDEPQYIATAIYDIASGKLLSASKADMK